MPGTASSKGLLGILPQILGLSDQAAAAGATLAISGSSFYSPKVTIGGASAKVVGGDISVLSVVVPAKAMNGSVVVKTKYGSASASFALLPAITSFKPASGKAGTSVQIAGAGFLHFNRATFI